MSHSPISRRLVLQAGGVAGLAAALGLTAAGGASAARARIGGDVEINDLGPAVVQFSLMSAVLVGDTVYIGSRNLAPARVIAFSLTTRKVVARTDLTTGYAIQTLAADPTGRYLYVGVLQKSGGSQPNLHRWDLTTPETPAVPIGRIGDRDVRALSVSPDGVLYAVGGGSPTAPALWEYDPGTGQVANLGVPDLNSTLARAVAATRTTVFFGAGTTHNGGGGTSRASLYAYDRAARTFTSMVPAEMQNDPSVRDLAIVGDTLVVGSAATTESSKVAVMELGDLSSYTVTTSIGTTAKKFAGMGDDVYFANEAGLMVRTAAATIAPVEFDGPDLGEIWGVDCRAGKVLVTSAYGFVAEIDPVAKTSVVTDLGEAGAPSDPQSGMGMAAGGGYVYVGGTGAIARHTRTTGKVVNLRAPGEAKDAIVIGGVMYTGQYSGQGIWRHDPSAGESIGQVAAFAPAQNRPLDTCWDAVNKLVLVAVQCDAEGGGALWTYDRATNQSRSFPNPIDGIQHVRAVAAGRGIAYLGGDNAIATGTRGTVVAFDPVAGTELWRIETGESQGIAALAMRGNHLYGLSRNGALFVIDVLTRTRVHRSDVSSVSTGFAALVTNRGMVYGASNTTVFRFDPETFAVTAVVPEINGAWYSGPHITNDDRGRIYTLRGRNLVEIVDLSQR
ncbi:MAG TPA: PQQ-binding-like beta-propeller repeat protein [Actinokineospora sp.]|nr:PQQ-binding-like beta-propeller repeat protein [Actinokineospora sp.]